MGYAALLDRTNYKMKGRMNCSAGRTSRAAMAASEDWMA
jgi:hypothetical protein